VVTSLAEVVAAAGGTDCEVSFMDTDDREVKDRIDAANREKYRRCSSPVRSITSLVPGPRP
jgi:hypothetical protein